GLAYAPSRRCEIVCRASPMALALVSARYPQPSRMMRTRGFGRDIRLLLAPGSWLPLQNKPHLGDAETLRNTKSSYQITWTGYRSMIGSAVMIGNFASTHCAMRMRS